jgi:5-methylthioadenosine/S-adenosylhomocysteine deaminase
MKASHLTPFRHPMSHIVYAANGGDVDTVICNGEILMRNKELELLDEAEVIKLAEDAAEELLSKS